MKKITGIILGTILAFGMASPAAFAQMHFDLNAIRIQQNGQKQGTSYLENRPAGTSPIVAVVLRATEIMTLVIGSVAFVVIIGAGIMMIVNIGNEQSVTRAKGMFLYAILGLVLAFGSYFIIVFIQGLFVET